MIGAELGYRYVGSPIVVDEPGGPEHLFREYVPTTWPGARLPHVWLSDGVSVHDRIGDGFTLLQLADAAGADSVPRALTELGAPCTTLPLESDAARQVYGYDLLLLRPDLHVAWRGNRAPDDPRNLARLVTGHPQSS
jgi:hypothetical protein